MKILGYDIKIRKSGQRAYEAADKGRRGKAFRLARPTGVNREILSALTLLRDRSRHMVRNNGWSKRAVEAIVKHTVGEGIQPAPVGALEKTCDAKRLWRRWAHSTDCDWYGRTTFYGLQELAMRAIAEGGEVLVVRRWVDGGSVPIKLQLLEGDHLDQTRNGVNEYGIVRMGVQFDADNKLSGYWLFDYHPGECDYFGAQKYESRLIDKDDLLHAFEVLRIGQVRGVPLGVGSFMKAADFSDYEDAQLVKQKIAACFTAFIQSSEGPPKERANDYDDFGIEQMEPGSVEYLRPEEQITFADPPATGDYDMYSKRILQGVAAAYGITYEMLTMDYSNVNFTSGRMAKIDVSQNFRSWQYNLLVPQICAPVWEWFVSAAIVAGQLQMRIAADWTAPRVQQLDPVKETDAQVKRIKSGLATLSETLREMGREPEEFFEEYRQDKERCEALGITIDSIALGGTPPPR